MNTTSAPLLLVIGSLIAGLTTGCSNRISKDSKAEAVPESSAAESAGEAGGAAADVERSSVSDLDRPIAELLAARCEHDIPQYTCDECRYQVGAVKVDPTLLVEDGPIDTIRVGLQAVRTGLDLSGEVRLDEERAVFVAPRVPGTVRAIRVDIGSRVGKGQTLFEVESAEFADAKAAFLRSQAAHRLASITAEREAEMYEKRICPRKDLLEAQAARDQAAADERAATERLSGYGMSEAAIEALARGDSRETQSVLLPVVAPFPGTVLERNLSIGMAVAPGDPLVLVGDGSSMWVIANLYERDLAAFDASSSRSMAGSEAEVTVAACPGRTFHGHLDRIAGTMDPATRAAKARIVVANPDGLLRAGMFANVRLLTDTGRSVRAVPEDAVLEDEGRSFVFVRSIPPYFVRRPVKTDRSWGRWIEVTEGLAAGEVVATRGAFLLKSDVLRSKMGAGCAD